MVTVSTHYDIKAQQAMDGWKLTVKEMATVLTHPDTATNINAHLMSREDAFYHLFDNGGPGRIPKAVLAAELAPGKEKAEPMAALVVSRTFQQVLEKWKAENCNLAKDSLHKVRPVSYNRERKGVALKVQNAKYDQLATMMEA